MAFILQFEKTSGVISSLTSKLVGGAAKTAPTVAKSTIAELRAANIASGIPSAKGVASQAARAAHMSTPALKNVAYRAKSYADL